MADRSAPEPFGAEADGATLTAACEKRCRHLLLVGFLPAGLRRGGALRPAGRLRDGAGFLLGAARFRVGFLAGARLRAAAVFFPATDRLRGAARLAGARSTTAAIGLA
jgi:hypothetical protein